MVTITPAATSSGSSSSKAACVCPFNTSHSAAGPMTTTSSCLSVSASGTWVGPTPSTSLYLYVNIGHSFLICSNIYSFNNSNSSVWWASPSRYVIQKWPSLERDLLAIEITYFLHPALHRAHHPVRWSRYSYGARMADQNWICQNMWPQQGVLVKDILLSTLPPPLWHNTFMPFLDDVGGSYTEKSSSNLTLVLNKSAVKVGICYQRPQVIMPCRGRPSPNFSNLYRCLRY